MKKISLVELSQMEVKPKEIIFNKTKFEYDEIAQNYYYTGEDIMCFMRIYQINEPLIEIEEKPLLTDEEKEILKTITKTSLSTIKKIKKDNDNSLSLISILGDYDCTHEFKYKYFKNLGLNKEYKLDELGLEE